MNVYIEYKTYILQKEDSFIEVLDGFRELKKPISETQDEYQG